MTAPHAQHWVSSEDAKAARAGAKTYAELMPRVTLCDRDKASQLRLSQPARADISDGLLWFQTCWRPTISSSVYGGRIDVRVHYDDFMFGGMDEDALLNRPDVRNALLNGKPGDLARVLFFDGRTRRKEAIERLDLAAMKTAVENDVVFCLVEEVYGGFMSEDEQALALARNLYRIEVTTTLNERPPIPMLVGKYEFEIARDRVCSDSPTHLDDYWKANARYRRAGAKGMG